MTVIYLGGPINGCTDEEANGWREKFIDLMADRVGTFSYLDPIRRDYRGREDECVQEIIEGDCDDILDSDVILAYCWQPSWGTAMEIFYAWDRRNFLRMGYQPRRIVVVVPLGARVSPWLRGHSDVVVPTLEAAADWIAENGP